MPEFMIYDEMKDYTVKVESENPVYARDKYFEDLEIEHDRRYKVEVTQVNFYTAAIYEINKAFGGPEEGGWWYTYGSPATEPDLAVLQRRFKTEDEAKQYREDVLLIAIAAANQGREALGSVNCDGWYVAQVEENDPQPFPKRTPHYE